jgi:hypothetical protein
MKLPNLLATVFLALAAALLPALTSAAEGPYAGPEGKELPFSSAREVAEFLATAEEIASKDLSTGITKPKKLTLEKDGVRAHAVFHSIDRREQKKRRLENGNHVMYLRDSYRSQVAAFELSQLLRMTTVPPTASRRSHGRQGSVQLWIEEAMTEKGRRKKAIAPPDDVVWSQQKSDQWVFDNLINNIDRNTGNTLIDSSWNVWLIDHTRSFGADRQLPYPERVTSVSQELWAGLKALDPDEVSERLAPYLTKGEIKALLTRHQKLVERIEVRIDRLGEDRIVFVYGQPWVLATYAPAG